MLIQWRKNPYIKNNKKYEKKKIVMNYEQTFYEIEKRHY